MTDVVSAAYQEGKSAKAAGKPMEDDPYRAGSQESADWLEGYTADEKTDIGEDLDNDDV